MTESKISAHPRRRRRLIISGIVLGTVVVLVGLLPTIASHLFVPGMIQSSIAAKVDGQVTVEGLHLSWFGEQGVRRIGISSTDASTKLEISAEVHRSLLGLLFGWPDIGNVDVVLTGEGVLHDDGSTSFATLIHAPEDSTSKNANPSGEDTSAGVVPAGLGLDASLKVPSLRLRRGKSDDFLIKDLLVNAHVKTGGPITASLKTSIDVDGSSGTLSGHVDLENGLSADGHLDLAGASLTATIEGSDVRVPVAAEWAKISSLNISMKSEALGKGLKLTGKANGTLNEKSPISLDADLTLGALVSNSGEFVLGPDTIGGNIHAQSIPTSLLEPFVDGLGIDLSQDIGPSLNAVLTAGRGADRTVHIEVDASRFKLLADASISKAAITNGQFTVDATVPSSILTDVGLKAEKPMAIALVGEKISLALDSQGRPEPGTLQATLKATSSETLLLDAAAPIEIAGLDITLTTASLEQGVQIDAKATVDEAALSSQLTISDLLEKGNFDFEQAKVVAKIVLDGFKIANLAPFTKESVPPGVLVAAMGGPLSAELDVSLESLANPKGAENASLKVNSPDIDLAATFDLDFSSISVHDLAVESKITPKLVSTLGVDPKTIGTLDNTVVVNIKSTDLNVRVSDELTPSVTGTVTVTADGATLTLVDPAETVVLDEINLKLFGREAKGIAIDCSTSLATQSAKVATITASAVTTQGRTFQIEDVHLNLNLSDSGAVAKLAGVDPGPILALIGNTASISVTAPQMSFEDSPIELTASLDSPVAKGRFSGVLQESKLAKAEGTFDSTISPADLQEALGEDGGITLKNAVPMKAKFSASSLPFDMKSLNGAKASVELEADSAEFVGEDGAAILARSLKGTASLSGRSIQMVVNADILEKDPSTGSGNLVQGSVEFNTHATLGTGDTATKIGETIIQLQKVPTVLFELVGEDGKLATAALGRTVDATVTVTPRENDQSLVVAKLHSPYAVLDLPQAWIDEKSRFIIPAAKPLDGTLTISPSLSNEILSVLHPIFTDISTTKKPIELLVGPLTFPMDDQMKGLNGSATIQVGDVTLNSTQAGSKILSLLERSTASSLDARINPLNITATNGMVEYSNFVVELGLLDNGSYKQKLIFNGKINLAANPPTVIGISATYPASNLVGFFSELQKVPPALLDSLRPTVTFYGPLYDAKGQRIPLKTKIDPIDLKQGIQPDQVEGIIKGIGDLIRNRN